ncbi:mediator of RNA polymerase II transcription subunit 30-like [Diadema setosum]|uniref:mediator of RNA polymerase II transcription subunit 30-like n=1 Tax=Diadema antillarum TaxID=105358 RepID=UPI003A8C499F
MSGVGQSLGGSSTKEVNAATLCRMGQETVQDLVAEMQDMFSNLKGVQLPNGRSNTQQSHQEKVSKLQDITKHIEVHFKKLRLLYDKCIQISSGIHTASGTHTPSEDLITWKDTPNSKDLTALGSRERVQYMNEEKIELIQQVQAKNRQLRQVMDQMRSLMWDINTMLAMRHSTSDWK